MEVDRRLPESQNYDWLVQALKVLACMARQKSSISFPKPKMPGYSRKILDVWMPIRKGECVAYVHLKHDRDGEAQMSMSMNQC